MADSEPTIPKPITAPDDMHWGISYLRGDGQDMRAEAREARAEAKAGLARMDDKYEALLQRIDARFYLTMGMMATMTGVLAALMKL